MGMSIWSSCEPPSPSLSFRFRKTKGYGTVSLVLSPMISLVVIGRVWPSLYVKATYNNNWLNTQVYPLVKYIKPQLTLNY